MSTERDTANQGASTGPTAGQKKPAARPKARVRARAANAGSTDGGSAGQGAVDLNGHGGAKARAGAKRAASAGPPSTKERVSAGRKATSASRASNVPSEGVKPTPAAVTPASMASVDGAPAAKRASAKKKRVSAKAADGPARASKAKARPSTRRGSKVGKSAEGPAKTDLSKSAAAKRSEVSTAVDGARGGAGNPEAHGGSAPPARRRKASSRRGAGARATSATTNPGSDASVPSEIMGQRVAARPATTHANSQVPEVNAQVVEGGAPNPSVEPMRGFDAQLESIVRDVNASDDEAERRVRAAAALRDIAARLHHTPPSDSPETSGFGSARSILRTDHYLRQWGRLAMRGRVQDVDDFGFDPAYEAKMAPVLNALYRQWFRVEVKGLEHVPESGGAMLVSNHSGTLPWDGLMLNRALRLQHPRGGLRWLIDDLFFHMPFVGSALTRLGAVRACQDNAERVLLNGEALAVFPEGLKGLGKLYKQRYQLQRFGRGGYVRLALRAQVPVLPVAIVGAEESMPLLFKVNRLSRGLGLPYIPVTPTFPALGPLGLLPAPTKWHIQIGPPVALEGAGPERADDAVLVNRLNERIRAQIQDMVDHNVRMRSSVFR